MNPKVLIVEELQGNRRRHFDSFVICCEFYSYEYRVCHDLEQLPSIMDEFKPHIVFWTMYVTFKYVREHIDIMRRCNKDLKVVLATDSLDRIPYKETADCRLASASVMMDVFQKVITEQLFTNLYDDSAPVKQAKLHVLDKLSDFALRAIAAEQMWRIEQRQMERYLKRKNKGEKLGDEIQQRLDWLIQARDLLMQYKQIAAEILIERGVSESAEELMNPPKGNLFRPRY
ncbi:MAG: hypothetical protein GY803_06475 [Chloroflexi bacterium]|nr:hypothetical protein [Chloroflexota bacterium]